MKEKGVNNMSIHFLSIPVCEAIWRGFLGAAFLSLTWSGQAAPIYNAVNDFSITNGNPNGVWSYRYGTGGSLLPTGAVDTFLGGTQWWNGANYPNYAGVEKCIANCVSTDGNVLLPAGYLNLDPQTNSDVDVRFTAPSTAYYSVSASFLGTNLFERSHGVQILDNSVVIFSGTIAIYNQSAGFNGTVFLNSGDTLDFESLGTPIGTYLGTGLQATAGIPEPGGLWLGGIGIACLTLIRRKR